MTLDRNGEPKKKWRKTDGKKKLNETCRKWENTEEFELNDFRLRLEILKILEKEEKNCEQNLITTGKMKKNSIKSSK